MSSPADFIGNIDCHRVSKLALHKLRLKGAARAIRAFGQAAHARWLAAVHPHGRRVRTSLGAIVHCDFSDPNFRWYYGRNLFLEQEHKAFSALLSMRRPRVILDIGAHWGVFPAMLAADPQTSNLIERVICIEPDPHNIPNLRRTVAGIDHFEVTIVEAAIGGVDSTIEAYREGGSCLHTYGTKKGKCDLVVPVRRLDTILCDIGVKPSDVTHVKIDIDGYEPSFFFGNQDTLRLAQPLVMSEYWAQGLMAHPTHNCAAYYTLLQQIYHVLLCRYPEGGYRLLNETDYHGLNKLTEHRVANLVLIPRSFMHLPEVRKTFSC